MNNLHTVGFQRVFSMWVASSGKWYKLQGGGIIESASLNKLSWDSWAGDNKERGPAAGCVPLLLLLAVEVFCC